MASVDFLFYALGGLTFAFCYGELTMRLLIEALNFLLAPLIGAEGNRLLRDVRGPTGAKQRGGSRTARGKRLPAADINN
ncbi:hypothetical protein BpOF4_11315 [Alkalihalophilus pseudofirmus OF4]|uniref:Uncharacterized protein n=1 Tax=Alkalihalophilus pseudofirmus (strain ATCC BAA-2126 / JCM 17055 / OF4) TaxID=398511 RepID=D3FVB5_ALKPO|nr:hypothetical protein BpOF4_11315 [Alkalihalophilus pseudofirmus OF4]